MLSDHSFNEGLRSLLVLNTLFWRQYHEGQKWFVRNLATLLRVEDGLDSIASRKDLTNLRAYTVSYRSILDVRSAISITLVQVLLETEVIVVALNREIVAGISKGFEDRFYVANVELWLGNRQADLGTSGFCTGHTAVRFKEDGCRHFPVQPGFADRFHRFIVQANGMGVLLTADVGGDGGFKAMLSELFEHRSAKLGVVQGRCADADERVAVAALETFLIGMRYPEG